MKKKCKSVFVLLLAVVMVFCSVPVQDVSAKANTCVTGKKKLKKNTNYYYDLDGNGKKEKIKWKVVNKKKTTKAYVYINGKAIYTKKLKNIGDFMNSGWRLTLVNIDEKDKYVEMLLESVNEVSEMEVCRFMRYKKGKIVQLLKYKQNNGKRFGVDTYGQWTIKGDGTVINKSYMSLNSVSTTGGLIPKVVLKLKNGKLTYTKKNMYDLAKANVYPESEYNYMAGNTITVYKSYKKDSGVELSMSFGERFKATQVYISKWKKQNGKYQPKQFWVKIKTSDGKSGWVFIPSISDETQDFTGGGTVMLPGWS